MKKVKNWQVLLFGGVIGMINGFFGGGAGMIVVPMLTNIFGMEQKKAQATALFVILPLSLVSSIVYLINNGGDIFNEWPVILGIVIGGVIGALLLNKLNNKFLKILFIGFMLFGGFWMLLG